MKRKLAMLPAFILILLAACAKPPAPAPTPEPEPAPLATPATLPVTPPATPPEPLPPISEAPEASELPVPAQPVPAPAPADEPVATEAAPDFGIPINEDLPAEPPVPDIPPPNTAKIELELLLLINALREASGVEPLGLQEEMLYAARIRSAEALERFSHTRPDDTPYNTAFDEAGFSYAGKWHGENLASLSYKIGQLEESEAALKLFEGLSSSPGHRENMARGNFSQTGVGVAAYVENETVTLASAQLFASF